MPRNYDEKRDYIRVEVDTEIRFREQDAEQDEAGRMVNLSGRGMLFIAEFGLPVNTMLEVMIQPENNLTPPLHANVKVVRMEKNRKGEGYHIGAVIQEMLDDGV